MRRAVVTALALLATLVASSPARADAELELTPVGRLPFPERGYVVDLPGRAAVDPASVRVRENGRLVEDVDVAPVAAAGIHFGVVLAVDASESMTGAPLRGAVDAARAFVAGRDGDQEVGIVAFNGEVTLVRRPTKDGRALNRALATPPALAYGTRIHDAVEASLRLLAQARLSSGSIVLLSDGADIGSRATLESVIATARARHVRVFTVGLRSGAFESAPLRRLAAETGGLYAEASSPERLASIFTALGRRLSSEYLIRYRSDAPPRAHVSVAVTFAGVGAASAEYVAPTPAGLRPFHRSPFSRFMTSDASPFVLGLVVALLAAATVAIYFGPRRRTLAERVREFAEPEHAASAARERARAHVASVRTRAERGLLARLERNLEIARLETSARTVVLATAVATVGSVVALALVSPIFAVLGLVCPLVTRALIGRKLRQVRDAFADQLAPNLQVLASALRIGHSLIGALTVVVENAHEPSQSELRRAVADEQLGVPIEEAVRRVAERMECRDLEQVALLAELQRTAGGNAAEVLDTIVETLRERADLRRLVKTLTAQGRMARWILSSLPLLGGLVMAVIQPAAIRPLVETGPGRAALVVAALLVVTGSLAIQKIVDIKV